jgi:hypothetical protein
MTTLETKTTMVERSQQDTPFDEAQLAAAAFLARYSGRTLDAYRHDLRMFFQWASDNGLEVLKVVRPHIELYRCSMEARGLGLARFGGQVGCVDYAGFAWSSRGWTLGGDPAPRLTRNT